MGCWVNMRTLRSSARLRVGSVGLVGSLGWGGSLVDRSLFLRVARCLCSRGRRFAFDLLHDDVLSLVDADGPVSFRDSALSLALRTELDDFSLSARPGVA